ncbi:hypothetical protein M3611_23675 [Priestia megaterium]|uniref:hypothetical protein n=1 Tax=Priestia megaterium TaxID=1404 RepID=UPI002042187F|nr:hypothetical protein [Priestia megaterium]MCM3155015.1 hypothetical protein [Priestia megaterium]
MMSNDKEHFTLYKFSESNDIIIEDTEVESDRPVRILDADRVKGLKISKSKVKIISQAINQMDMQEVAEIKAQLAEVLEAIKIIEEGKETGQQPALWMTAIEKLGPTGTALLEMYLKSRGAIE